MRRSVLIKKSQLGAVIWGCQSAWPSSRWCLIKGIKGSFPLNTFGCSAVWVNFLTEYAALAKLRKCMTRAGSTLRAIGMSRRNWPKCTSCPSATPWGNDARSVFLQCFWRWFQVSKFLCVAVVEPTNEPLFHTRAAVHRSHPWIFDLSLQEKRQVAAVMGDGWIAPWWSFVCRNHQETLTRS